MSQAKERMEPATEAYGTSVRDRPVPRISIHAFCEKQETSKVIEQAAQDRRLAKAHVTLHPGGIRAAAKYFADSSTPNLILVECNERGSAVLDCLEELAQVCDPNSKVIVIGEDNDIALYRELIRQGVNEYLVGPLEPLQIIEAISALYAGPESAPIGRVFAFIGAKGGAGSSTICHNVAWSIAEHQRIETAIVDLDLPFGTAGLDFNEDPGQGVADALGSPERLDDVLLDRLLVKCTEHLSIFAAPATIDRDYEIEADAYETVLDIVRQTVPCVIVDLPHVWSPWARNILTNADEIIITAAPELASLRNARNLFDHLKQARPNDAAPRLILNQVGIAKRPEIPAKDFAEALGSEPALVLPFDPPLFGTAANNGQMVFDVNANARAAEAFRQFAMQLTGREVRVEAKPANPFLEFFKAKKAS
ncbi:MAG: AAA family ATPase [Alphaproteobacteria bacterium]|nr:AAA family ATPase [Alphaproteobacteria bacterium]